jgi:hypothetical protein
VSEIISFFYGLDHQPDEFILLDSLQNFHPPLSPLYLTSTSVVAGKKKTDLCWISAAINFAKLNPVFSLHAHSVSIKNFHVLPLSTFVCFVWISEQTAIISLYSIN